MPDVEFVRYRREAKRWGAARHAFSEPERPTLSPVGSGVGLDEFEINSQVLDNTTILPLKKGTQLSEWCVQCLRRGRCGLATHICVDTDFHSLLYRNLSRRPCGIPWTVRDIPVTSFLQKRHQITLRHEAMSGVRSAVMYVSCWSPLSAVNSA